MRALLLAAGLGTRLRPLTNTVPKCMVEIGGRPLLDHWIAHLGDAGVKDILVNLHYLPEIVTAHLKSTPYPATVSTVYEEELLGTGGTLLKNRTFFGDEPVMLIHADNLSMFDVRAFIRRFETRRANIDLTMMTFRTDVPETCGIVDLDEFGTVTGFYEKVRNPPGNLANAAVYILGPVVMKFLAGLGKPVIDVSTEVLPHFLGRMNTFENDVYHRDIGTMESYQTALREFPAVMQRLANR